MKENLRKEKGITLIALVITIIVLLILAILTIRIMTNENIIGHANNAVTAYNEAQQNESDQLTFVEGLMQNKGGSSSNGQSGGSNSGVSSGIETLSSVEMSELENHKYVLNGIGTQYAIAQTGESRSLSVFENNGVVEVVMINMSDHEAYIMMVTETGRTTLGSLFGGSAVGEEYEVGKLYRVGENGGTLCTNNPISGASDFEDVHCQSYFDRLMTAINASF